MGADIGYACLEQFGHALLCEPNGFAFEADVSPPKRDSSLNDNRVEQLGMA